MSEDQTLQLQQELEKKTEEIQDTNQYVKETQIHSCIDALILAGLVAVVFQTFSYVMYGTILSDLDAILYMFSLLVGPSALFLLLLHFYQIYGIVKRGEKSIPLTLDLMYFIYLAVAFATMIGLNTYYQRHDISTKFLTQGWSIAVLILCAEVLVALLLAKYVVTMLVSPHLPHFFDHQPRERKIKVFVERSFKPQHVYYFWKKPDVSSWENEACFIRYKH
jgi:hypothetical protein